MLIKQVKFKYTFKEPLYKNSIIKNHDNHRQKVVNMKTHINLLFIHLQPILQDKINFF